MYKHTDILHTDKLLSLIFIKDNQGSRSVCLKGKTPFEEAVPLDFGSCYGIGFLKVRQPLNWFRHAVLYRSTPLPLGSCNGDELRGGPGYNDWGACPERGFFDSSALTAAPR